MKVTFTGVDSFTNLSLLSNKAEYGILLSLHNITNRYPSFEEVSRISSELKSKGFSLALHVCGSEAREKLLNKELPFIDNFQRIQVNGKMKVEKCKLIADLYPNHEIIFQFNEFNESLPYELRDIKNISFLVDNSGGRGISPSKWNNPSSLLKVGYAGGLGLQNVIDEVSKIKNIAREDFWIDMEGKIRTEDDKFDVNITNKILEILNV